MKKTVGGTKWWQVRGIRGYVMSYCLSTSSSRIPVAKAYPVLINTNVPVATFRVDAEWITARKDWQEAKRREKEQQSPKRQGTKWSKSSSVPLSEKTTVQDTTSPESSPAPGSEMGEGAAQDGLPDSKESNAEPNGTYQPEMDEMRCILYSHGGEFSVVTLVLHDRIPTVHYFYYRRVLFWEHRSREVGSAILYPSPT